MRSDHDTGSPRQISTRTVIAPGYETVSCAPSSAGGPDGTPIGPSLSPGAHPLGGDNPRWRDRGGRAPDGRSAFPSRRP
jgi:hypothetical protein